jgi:hypothetical protein
VPGRNGARRMARSGVPGGAGEALMSASLLEEVGVRLNQAEGDRARGVVGVLESLKPGQSAQLRAG